MLIIELYKISLRFNLYDNIYIYISNTINGDPFFKCTKVKKKKQEKNTPVCVRVCDRREAPCIATLYNF